MNPASMPAIVAASKATAAAARTNYEQATSLCDQIAQLARLIPLSSRMKVILEDLRAVTHDCRDDMHEPDEQGLSARIVGNHLDNAFGNDPDSGEFVVIISRDDGGSEALFNLADLIALARKAATPSQPKP